MVSVCQNLSKASIASCLLAQFSSPSTESVMSDDQHTLQQGFSNTMTLVTQPHCAQGRKCHRSTHFLLPSTESVMTNTLYNSQWSCRSENSVFFVFKYQRVLCTCHIDSNRVPHVALVQPIEEANTLYNSQWSCTAVCSVYFSTSSGYNVGKFTREKRILTKHHHIVFSIFQLSSDRGKWKIEF